MTAPHHGATIVSEIKIKERTIMYIGRLFPEGEATFTHADSVLALSPETVENGVYTFSWKKFYDTAIDVHMSLADACFVGAVCVTLPENSVTRADVLLDGTQLLFVGDEEDIMNAFSVQPREGAVFLPHVMSRKKQIIPSLSALWG